MEKYKILEKIGNGSFGKVYKASRKGCKNKFAIKQVQCNAPENVELALQEFWTLSSLQPHLNIIRFEECFQQRKREMMRLKHGDVRSSDYLDLVEVSIKGKCNASHCATSLWFVMEYCDCGDMNDYILSKPPTAHLNSSFMLQLADGISFLHTSNVVHRDLKPENILVRHTSKDKKSLPILKIADFGLSKVCTRADTNTPDVNHHWFSSACGSDFFMAPEVFEGRYTAKADVFALGIIFWSIMDRITFIDASSKKVLLGTYVRRGGDVLPLGEALLDDPKLDIAGLLLGTSHRKPVSFVRGMNVGRKTYSSTCVEGDKDKLRQIVCGMVDANGELRPSSESLFKQLSTLLSVQRMDDVSKKKNPIKSVVSRKQSKRIPSSVKNGAVSRRKTHKPHPIDHPLPDPPSDNTDDDVINTTVNNDCDKRSAIVTRSKGRVGNMVKTAVKMPWKKCSVVIPMGSHGSNDDQQVGKGIPLRRSKLSLKEQINSAAKVTETQIEAEMGPTPRTGLRRSGRTIRKPAKLRLKLETAAAKTKLSVDAEASTSQSNRNTLSKAQNVAPASPTCVESCDALLNEDVKVGVTTRSMFKQRRRKGKIQRAQVPSPDIELAMLTMDPLGGVEMAEHKRSLTPSDEEMPSKRAKLSPEAGSSGDYVAYLAHQPIFTPYYPHYLPGDFPSTAHSSITPNILTPNSYPLSNPILPHSQCYPFHRNPMNVPNIAARP